LEPNKLAAKRDSATPAVIGEELGGKRGPNPPTNNPTEPQTPKKGGQKREELRPRLNRGKKEKPFENHNKFPQEWQRTVGLKNCHRLRGGVKKQLTSETSRVPEKVTVSGRAGQKD